MAVAYDSAFYATYSGESMASAREILQITKELVSPRSVVDVGCGIGTWLRVWMELGAEEVLGIDGSYVRPETLLIPVDRFQALDLTGPQPVGKRFDLVESLEVAEHLPESAAKNFVSFLCSLGPIILFSAAIPYQGGTHHVNEQWPEYWAALFAEHDYVALDLIRERVWDNERVAYYYAQNAFIFAQRDHCDRLLRKAGIATDLHAHRTLSRVHPRKWREKNERPMPLRQLVRMLPGSVSQFAAGSVRKLAKILPR